MNFGIKSAMVDNGNRVLRMCVEALIVQAQGSAAVEAGAPSMPSPPAGSGGADQGGGYSRSGGRYSN